MASSLHRDNNIVKVAFSAYRDDGSYHLLGIGYRQFVLQGTGTSLNISIVNQPAPRFYRLDRYPIGDPPEDQFGQIIDRPAVGGIQFSPDGTKIYFVKSPNYEYDFPPNGVTAATNFGYIDLEWTLGDPDVPHHYLPIDLPTETRKLADTQMFTNVGPDGVTPTLYMTRNELIVDTWYKWISTFEDPDNPDPANFEMFTLEVSDVGTFIDEAPPEYRLLNQRVIGSTHLTQMQDPVCCVEMLLTRDRSATIVPGCQTIWSPGNNPFYNTFAPIDVVSELRIAAGVSVSAADMEFRFAPDAVLVIEPGATFISNNCTFTSSCGGQWKGIRVEGTTSNWQQQSGSQGRLFLEPGSVVEHAEIGAWTAREIGSNAPDPLRFGGIVRANGATFIDCTTGIRIERFHRRIPFTSLELNNLSSVANTSFRTTEDWIGPANPYAHIYLYDVNGISITNSSFANKAPELFATTERGWGVVGLDAAFTCNGSNPVDHFFESLSVGVVGSAPDLLERYVVNSMSFKDNLMGIVDLGSTGSRITRNTFSLLDDENETTYGLMLYSSELYTVERNEFGRPIGDGAGYAGITFIGTSFAGNQVYDNTYSKLTVGNWVRGQQRNPNFPIPIAPGLQMRCGTHEGNVVTHFYSEEAVVRSEQGLPGPTVQQLANNEHNSEPGCDFTAPSGIYFHPFVLAFQNYDLFVNYNFYDFAGSPEQRPSCVEDEFGTPETFIGDWFYDLVPNLQASAFDKEVHCAVGILDIEETFQGLTAGSMAAEYQQSVAALTSAMHNYQGTVDLGQKVDLLEALRQEPPMPSHQLRDVLLAHHPLSDEVLKEAIFRTEPLDPWHLTQVLIANSRLNGWVLQALSEQNVLPAYFLHLVRQAQSGEVGIKRLLELEIMQRQQERDLLLTRLLEHWSADTLSEARADSVLALLAADSLGFGPYGHLAQYAFAGDAQGSEALSQALREHAINDDFVQFTDMLAQADGALHELKGHEWDLQRMAFNESPGSGALAWSALLVLQHLDSVPMPQLPGMLKSLWMPRPTRSAGLEQPLISVLPNPASDRIGYVVPMHESMEQGVLEVFDAQGRQVQIIALNGRRGLIESSVVGWRPGLYMVRLLLDGNTLGSAKFTVVR